MGLIKTHIKYRGLWFFYYELVCECEVLANFLLLKISSNFYLFFLRSFSSDSKKANRSLRIACK